MLKSFFKLLTRCYRLALPYGQLKLFGVLAMISLNGLLQLVGVSSIFPFFALAADPDRIKRSPFGSWLLHLLPPMDTNHLLVVSGVFAIAMLLLSSIGSMLSEYYRIRYSFAFSQWLRGRLFESYNSKPYSFFVSNNSAKLAQKVYDITGFTGSVLLPLGEVLSRIILIVFLVSAVFLVQPWIAVGAALLFGGFYLGVFSWLKPRTKFIGDALKYHNNLFNQNTNQFFHGIKTTMVHSKGGYFIQSALEHSKEIGRVSSRIPIYSNGPRYLIEPVAFGGLVGIVVILALQGRPFADILPNLSVMAMAGYRLLPSLQMLYSQLVNIASNSYTLVQLEEDILEIEREFTKPNTESVSEAGLKYLHEIKLDNILFRYAGSLNNIFEGFSLSISKNQSIGIAGPSGSGKSTLVDLILGLHTPLVGVISVDDTPLTGRNMNAWRKMIGYVPQDIYLIDNTIAMNIAYGVDEKDIDLIALREAAESAQILEFIENELPDGFKTRVGERGVRLSGGQRQRIGLARALYHKPQVLILDEATSALDHQTEAAVMETIHRLQGTLTIITIAHRLSTLERCDRIIRLEKGKIV